MRVGIDGRYIQDQYHGIGRYIYEVALNLADGYPDQELVIFYNPAYPNTRFSLDALAAYPNLTLVQTSLRLFRPEQQLGWPWLLRRYQIDLFHTPFFDAPILAPCPVTVTIHDLIFDRYPAYMPQRHFRLYYWLLMRLSLQKAAQVITVSEATRNDLAALYAVNPDKISVTPEAAALEFQPASRAQTESVRARYNLPDRFILTVGTRRPHKNIATLVQAFAQIAPHTDAALVLAGQADARWPDDITPLVEQFKLHERIIQPGQIAEADLPALYTQAEVFAFPSLIEGFGLPPLEAMACGTAVVVSNTSSLPEVVGPAGLLVDPLSVKTMASALLTILEDPTYRRELERRSLVRANEFSWRRTARLTRRAYHRALNLEPAIINPWQTPVDH